MVSGLQGVTYLIDSFPVGRKGSGDVQFRFLDGMYEADLARMEADAAIPVGTRGSVFQVTFDDASHSCQLTSDLVVSAGQQLDFQQMISVGMAEELVDELCQFGIFPGTGILADEALVHLLIADEVVIQFCFWNFRSFADQCVIGLVDFAFSEEGSHPFQGLGGLGKNNDAADRAVKAVRYTQIYFSWLVVPLGDESLVGIRDGRISGLVSLGDLAYFLVDDQQMVVFI